VSGPVWRRVLLAVAALVVAWLAVPAAVPIYDGPGFPDQPYRYVQPPPGAKATPPPTSAHQTLKVTGTGLNQTGYANSGEIGPQIVYYVPPGAFKAPTGATTIDVSETPLAPSPPLPTDGTVTGNVYRVTATTAKGPVTVVGHGVNQLPTLNMRAPSAKQPGPVFEYRTNAADSWHRASTLRIGQDIYQTSAPVLGDYALVQVAQADATSSSGGGVNVALLASGIGVIVFVGIVVAIRLARSRRTA
jgi:hypothetical protein